MAYAELHCISNYSFLRGASHPEELVAQAAARGYSAIALTDECSMAGVVKAHVAAKEHGIKLIVGSEFRLDEELLLILLAPNRVGYGQICNLITIARRRADKGEYRLSLHDLEFATDQCLAVWVPGEQRSHHGKSSEKLKTMFANRLWLGLEIFPDGKAISCYEYTFDLSRRFDLPVVASGDVHMHHSDRKPLLDVISAVRMRQSIALAGRLLFANREKYLRSISQIEQLYPAALLEATCHIADLCHFSLDELRYEYPKELVPPGLTSSAYLRQLTYCGLEKRWPDGTPPSVLELIEKELTLIAEMQYEYYFLTVFDIVQYAKSQSILCQGRGSAANSAVCYCLEITEVDPARINLLFERFISKERNEPPDIDVDFEHERREEVIQYIYKKYGRHRAAIAATVVTYRPKSAIRDVGKALGLDLQLVDHLAKSLSWWDKREELQTRFEEAGINPRSMIIDQFLTLVNAILGFPRHLSQHVGGFVISSGPLSQLVPVENAAMIDRTIIQWDKDDLESLGLLKVDILALGMLTSIRKSLDMINVYRDMNLSLATIPPEDPLTYHMLQQGDSIGVFQVESRAQISMLPRLKPKNFYDLVIEVAIVRPGPIQGKMVHPYLKRRNGDEKVTYANDAVKGVLGRTLGVPIFQEQVIKLAVVAAGFTPGEADQLRRAMAAWKRKGGLDKFQQNLINGMLERGHDRDFAERIFEQIKGFGDYGFPESHAASFALLVYISAWLKRHEPAAFYCGLLNSQPMGFYSPSQLVQDARRHNIEVRPVDISHSEWESTLEAPTRYGEIASSQPAVRLGFQRIKGFREEAALRIMQARGNHPVRSVQDIARRAQLDKGDLARLTEGSAFKSLTGHRYQTHWQASGLLPDTPLLGESVAESGSRYETPVILPAPLESDDLRADYTSLGLTLGRHPMAMLREQPDSPFRPCKTATQLKELNHGRFVQVAGVVTGRQRPSSASGVLFLTLEDETDNVNVVVWTRVLETFRTAVVQGRLLKVKGVLEREASVIHIIAGHVEDLSHYLEHFSLKSRDFK
ncbi:MAG: error-prone DNA polymerase [Gammaproteobacteria bacterium]|jgi:error-prone DNA polymerase|nr:error-prone DNA polymerase [Gammaproteobacteria bacterium]MBT4494951.1 error-prone DNA polymerase [Gammaproteobacteria bacterium]